MTCETSSITSRGKQDRLTKETISSNEYTAHANVAGLFKQLLRSAFVATVTFLALGKIPVSELIEKPQILTENLWDTLVIGFGLVFLSYISLLVVSGFLMLLKAVVSGKPTIRTTPQGLIISQIKTTKIPWDDILSVKAHRNQALDKVITISLKNSTKRSHKVKDFITRETTYVIGSVWLGSEYKTIAQTIDRCRTRYGTFRA